MAKEETLVSGMAGRYAQALHALAVETNTTDQVGRDLTTFQNLIDESADLKNLVKSPVFSADEQARALTATLAKVGIVGAAANFIKLVAEKRRLFAIEDMIADYRALDEAAKGVARARVTVATALSDQQSAALQQQLSAVSGGKSIKVDVKVDPTIIGGLIVQIGSQMVDSSLKTKLNSIRTRMKEVG